MEDIKTAKIMPYDCIVIGAGPSGLMASIAAARLGSDTMVIEHRDKPLKKLYATGNGRCNFTNLQMGEGVYRGNDPSFAYSALQRFGRDELLDFMHDLGLMTKNIGDYVYPYNEQARSVADALLLECKKYDIPIKCNEEVIDITHDDLFTVTTGLSVYKSRRLIIASGGKASPSHGSDGSMNKFIRAFGHKIILQRPALVPLKFADRQLGRLAGVRVKCGISLLVNDSIVSSEQGEIIFNKDNISGIPIMQVSRYATAALSEKCEAAILIDLFPDLDTDRVIKAMEAAFFGPVDDKEFKRRTDLKHDRTSLEALGLCINEKLAEYCLYKTGIPSRSLAGSCSAAKIRQLALLLKRIEIAVTSDAGYDRAQATAGGVDVSELTENMESHIVPGLYIAGELCDIDGTCGGYNLQWAFTSGYIAGMSSVL